MTTRSRASTTANYSAPRAYRSRTDEPADEQAQIQIRLASDLRDRLQAEASRRVVSVNYLAERALEEMVAKWENQKLT